MGIRKNKIMINKETLSKYFLISIGVFIVFVFLYGIFINTPKFQKKGKYTVGLLYKYRSTKGGGRQAFFMYSVNGKDFKERSSVSSKDLNDNDIGKRFIVKYVEGEESLSNLLLQYPVPDSIKSAPPNGWKELPNWAKKDKK